MAEQRSNHEEQRARRLVADALRKRIDSGELVPGDKLPAIRQLEVEFGVARNTALAAVHLLRDEGWVDARPNATARVRDRATDVDRDQEVRELRTELVNLRTKVKETGAVLTSIDDRLSEVVARLAALGD